MPRSSNILKKTLPWVLFAAAAVGILFVNGRRMEAEAAKASISKSGKPVVKIGVVTPMSGNFAVLKEIAVVMEKRAEELNADPKNQFEYKMIFEDSQFDPKISHMAAVKLLSVDHVDILVSVASLSAKPVQPLVERYGVPHFIMGGEELAGGRWNFTYFTTAIDTARLTMQASKALGYKSYVAMGQRQEAGLLIAAALTKAAQEVGIEDKGAFLWNPSDLKDFRGYLLRARETKADMFVLFPTPPDPDIFFRQMKELGMTTPVVGIESYEMVENKKWVEGRWLAGCPPLRPAMREKLKNYGIESKLTYDPYAYDFPGILIAATEAAGKKLGGAKPSREQIRESLAEMKTVETSMGLVKQDDEGVFSPAPVLIYYQNGVGHEVSLEELKNLIKK